MFDVRAQERLGFYVYALLDSRDPRVPFYVGKGCGNRVFAHANGILPDSDHEDEPLGPKLKLITEIKESDHCVLHKIVRFGLSEEEALKIEAALIDMVNHMYPDRLTNQISGQGVAEGMYDAQDLALSLQAPELTTIVPLLLIKIERQWSALLERYGSGASVPHAEIYDATRASWRLSVSRASKAECVLAVARGLVRAVFVPLRWINLGDDGRKAMEGQADASKYSDFVGCSVAHLFERGSQNPVRYLRC